MFESIDKYMRSHVDIDDLAASVKYKRAFRKANPTYFEPDGILVFCGPQGSGKTLSAVRYVLDLLRAFPHAIHYRSGASQKWHMAFSRLDSRNSFQ